MANEEHLAILKQGVEGWNRWREKNPGGIDLINANLSGANLVGANLLAAYLQGVDLSNADLSNADFAHATLTNANLSGANLSRANLTDANFICANLKSTILMDSNLFVADLIGANLRNADFTQANLRGANLSHADIAEALISNTIFASNDLSAVIGLDAVWHQSPSTIGIDTIIKSKGSIPEAFLRGCGLSDWQIENTRLFNPDLNNEEITDIQYKVHSLRISQAVQIKPLFISYSHSDGSFVDGIEPHLNKRGIRFWRDIHHATSGKLERQIDQAIRSHPVVLLILSANSVESDWVQHEARLARKLEQETKCDVLCPIALDDAWKTCDWPGRLREQIEEYNVLDFSRWQDQAAFDRMFARLIEGLGIFYK